VIGAEAGLTIQTPDPVLPSWWRIDPGGLPDGGRLAHDDGHRLPGCADAWGGLASGSNRLRARSLLPAQRAGLRLSIAMPPGQSRVLPGEPYAMFRIRVTRAGTVGPGIMQRVHIAGVLHHERIESHRSHAARVVVLDVRRRIVAGRQLPLEHLLLGPDRRSAVDLGIHQGHLPISARPGRPARDSEPGSHKMAE
jgi:hypothetical protein